MKLKKEFLIGLIVVIISVAMFYTIRFIQGANLFSDSIKVHASYPKINNLQVGNPIYINGLKIGLITATDISQDSDAHIDVEMTLETKYPIPNDSKAEIMELGLMGSMAMDILLGQSKTILKDGDRIQASLRTGMIDNVVSKMDPVVDQSGAFIAKIDTALAEYTQVAKNLNRIIAKIEIEQKLRHIDEMVLSFTRTSEVAQSTLSNFSELSDSLKAIEFGKVVNNLDELLLSSNELIKKAQSEDGSLNKLMTEPELYDNLKHSTESLDLLLKDLKANPKRYMHFSVFGRKDKSKKK